jgi:hypothetical protein
MPCPGLLPLPSPIVEAGDSGGDGARATCNRGGGRAGRLDTTAVVHESLLASGCRMRKRSGVEWSGVGKRSVEVGVTVNQLLHSVTKVIYALFGNM